MVHCRMGGAEGSPKRIIDLSKMPGVGREEGLEVQKLTVSKEACVAGLSDVAAKRVEDYCATLFADDGVDRDKLDRTKSFFLNSGALGKVVSIYSDLLPKEDQVTPRKQKLLGAHLSFVLERAIDQQLNDPENYVSHGFNHTLNVVKYTDQTIMEYPGVIDRVHWQYDVTPSQAIFVLRNVALFHDFGYPVSESKKLNKASHSVIGADVVSNGQIEIDGKMITAGNVLREILDDTSNGRIVNDLRNSIMLHNADKIDHLYDVKVKAKGGIEFLVDRENIKEAIIVLKQMGYETYEISVCIDESEDSKKTRIEVMERLFKPKDDKDSRLDILEEDIFLISTETGEKYKGRRLGKKGENSILGLEYSDAAMMKNPLIAVLRIADNMDMVMAERFSDLQLEGLFMAYLHELGDERSEFYEDNKNMEILYEIVKQNRNLDELREEVLKCILKIEKNRQENDLKDLGNSEEMAKNFANLNSDNSLKIWKEKLSKLDVDECISCWRGFILDQIALRPEFKQVDEIIKAEIKQVAIKMNSSELKHFGGFEAVSNVQMNGNRIDVTVDKDLYKKLNKIKVKEKIRSANGQVSFFEIGVGEYQIWRMLIAFENLNLWPEMLKFSIYVNGKKYNPD